MKKLMFFRPLYSLGGTEIAMLNLVKKLEGYEIYIGYSDETSDKHLLDRFAEYASIVNLNEVQDFEVDAFITCSAHYNLVEAVKNNEITLIPERMEKTYFNWMELCTIRLAIYLQSH